MTPPANIATASRDTSPIVVDFDGTLTPLDSMWEMVAKLAKSAPLALVTSALHFASGRAAFKAAISKCTSGDPPSMFWNAQFLAWLKEQKSSGRRLLLLTGADQKFAAAAVRSLELFDEVVGSDGNRNLVGNQKAAVLVKRFGPGGYAYAGNSSADLPVWAAAGEIILVNTRTSVARRARSLGPAVAREFPGPAQLSRAKIWITGLRLRQWTKNTLVFVPMLGAHLYADSSAWISCLLAFIAFGLGASAVYLLNDLTDLPADRAHPEKRRRPLASGALSLPSAVLAALVLATGSAAIGTVLGGEFLKVLGLYLAITTAYSLVLKRVALLDVVTLAGLYLLRLVAGGAATGAKVSFWLMAFSIFIFLSIGLVKRCVELRELAQRGSRKAAGRGYGTEDLVPLGVMGIASGYLAVLVLAFYINSPDVSAYYTRPEWLWGLCLLVLYWVSRAWLLAWRGALPEDPVEFVLRDRASHISVISCAVLYVLASI